VDDIQGVILYLRSRGIGILVTITTYAKPLGVTDRAYIMAEGKIFRSGVPHDLTEDAEVRRLYLGEKISDVNGNALSHTRLGYNLPRGIPANAIPAVRSS
jgi:hypothetical protein